VIVDLRSLFQQDFQPSELDHKLYELAVRYHKETEAFDRTVCTGPVIDGSVMPVTPCEAAVVNANARKLFRQLGEEAKALGATGVEFRKAITRADS
jgi:hypothetical protein